MLSGAFNRYLSGFKAKRGFRKAFAIFPKNKLKISLGWSEVEISTEFQPFNLNRISVEVQPQPEKKAHIPSVVGSKW